jgi:hypothetical protein
MRKRFKVVFVITLMVVMAFPGAVIAQDLPVNPVEPVIMESSGYIPIQPFWLNVQSIRATLSFNGTTALCGALVTAFAGSTMSGTAWLERVNADESLTLLRSWPVSSSSNTLIFNETNAVTRGHTYRFSITVTVTRNGVPETVEAETFATLQ